MDAARILDVARYMSRKDTRINAIDAAPVLCEDGTMWLAFGSWFAGIWMLRLDSATGLRDRSIRYPLIRDTTGNASVSDPYYGVKIAGGYWNSGEGAYLVQRDGWWFLMLSYGWLGRTGGYQIREFRARSPLGPFVDMHGNPAIALGETPHNETGRTGVRMLSSVHWHDGSDAIEVSQGHNSVLQRNDGRMFLVYHTRFADRFHPDDDEDFDMRVRELVMTDNGWLAVSPALYRESQCSRLIWRTFPVITTSSSTIRRHASQATPMTPAVGKASASLRQSRCRRMGESFAVNPWRSVTQMG